jgi:glutamate-1-semialdehyde 2,1-aminomutase
MVAPLGPVYQAGTLSGNPLSMAAGIATLRVLARPGTYDALEDLGATLAGGLESAARHAEVDLRVNRVGSMMTPFFAAEPVVDYDTAKRSDTARFARFHQGMLERGVYLPPSQFEAMFVSLAHTPADLEATIAAAEEALRALRASS